ncbi:2'-5' RNA ligase family protein [Clostridium niameyense]|uniref:2'-5' RNA ligase family protein n=1 Tax=Clostridium niameyense TaxID=1622073 RepID=UPI00067EDDDA|nr:2'-5' RNA ligase family protein [Clostridium niameyense]
MERYVIVCLVKGEALKFHESLVGNVCFKFKVNRQKLPCHFTIKAPFETDNIKKVENLIEEFTKDKTKEDLRIKGFNHFGNRVVYMEVNPSKNAIDLHNNFIYKLKTLNEISFKANENKNKVFHCTIVTKFPQEKFSPIWEYINNFYPNFNTYFDNISILKWNKNKWITYKEFKLK